MYSGNTPISTAKPFVEALTEKGIPHLYLTNNATRTPDEVVEYLREICDVETTVDHVYTSGLAAVDYVQKNYPGARTFVVGEAALQSQAEAVGLRLAKEDIAVVLQALDRDATYDSLTIASRAIQNGAAFIATNPDTKLPIGDGFIPGAGALTSFLQASTHTKPVIIGKPFSPIMDGALDRLGLLREEVVMVGDNYTTDILAGINYGIDTILTLTGVTELPYLEQVKQQPTHIVQDLSEWKVF